MLDRHLKQNLHYEAAPPWYEKHIKRNNIPAVWKTIYRNNKRILGQSLPAVSVSNMRSLLPKISNFQTDLLERNISIALLSEIWEARGKKKKRKYKNEIEKMLEINSLSYISTPWASLKRGGGCAIVTDLREFTVEKIEVQNPDKVEVIYGLLRPKTVSNFTEIIAVSFYLPPKSKKVGKLFDHIITNCQRLITKYPKAVLYIGGDRNEFSITPLVVALPHLRQVVMKKTCNITLHLK